MTDAMAAGETSPPPPEQQKQEFPLVLLLRPIFPGFEVLSSRFRFLKPWESSLPTHDFLAVHAGTVRVLLCMGPQPPVDAAILACLPKLECVIATSAGVNHIDLRECAHRGIFVANAGSVFSDDAADYAVGLLIDVLRGVSSADRYVRSGMWPVKGDFALGSKLGGKRVGILGLGSIGSRIATRLVAFGCIVFYHSRTQKSSVPYKYFPSVCDLAAESDVLVLACALNSETHHIVSKEVLSAMGSKGIVINIGRGALIDEEELVRCLVQGEFGGAGLDVFEHEPHVPKELFEMENVVLSHHRAVMTPEAATGLLQLTMDNLESFFSNRPLLSLVSL